MEILPGDVLRRIEFELDGLPHMTNASGRNSTHWRAKKAQADLWKNAVAVELIGRWPGPQSPMGQPMKQARLTLTRFSSVSPDPDGLVSGFKHVIDGLVLAGVMENDKMENIGMPDYRWVKWPKGNGKIRVVVEETG